MPKIIYFRPKRGGPVKGLQVFFEICCEEGGLGAQTSADRLYLLVACFFRLRHLLATSAWTFSRSYQTATTLRLSYYCLVRGHLLATSAWTLSRSYYIDSSLHVGFRSYQSSPTRRARTENKKVNDHSRSSVKTREVSEGSVGVTETLGPAFLLVLMARCKTRKTLHRQEAVPASTAVLPHTFASRLLGQHLCDSMRV